MFNYKYMQLAEQLKCEIIETHSAPGNRIPTEDELCKRFNVSRNTVRQAVNQLVDKGFLVKIQGCGTFVSERITEFLDKKRNSAKNRCIGVVMNQVNAYIFPSVLMGIADHLFENNYHMLIRMTFNRVAKERQVLKELLAADLAGLIVEPARSSLPLANEDLYRVLEKKLPCVVIHGDLPGFSFPSVDNANVDAYEFLTDYLVERGHRNIAAICKLDEQTGVKRYQGFVKSMAKNGLDVDERRILWYADEDFEDIFSDANAHRVLRIIKNCSAVACFNDQLAANFLPFLERHGLRVPDDVSVVGYDDQWQNPVYKPVTTIEHAKEKLGRAAAKAVLALLDNPFSDVSYRFPPKMVEYASVALLNAASTA